MRNIARQSVRARLLIVAAAAVLTLAACGASEAPEEPTTVTEMTSEAEEPVTAEETTSAAEETSSEEPETTGPPAACSVTKPESPLGAALAATEVPERTAIASVQELRPDSDVDQSLKWVRVDLCSDSLTEDQHRTIATDLAIAARDAESGGDAIWRLSVGLYVADGSGDLQAGRTLYVEDFSTYTWEREAARAPESIWKSGGE